MVTDGKATWWDATSGAPAYLAQELRQIDSLEVMPGPAPEPFSGRAGRRVNGKGLEVAVSSSGNGSVTVSSGPCLLYSSEQASQGVWRAQFPQIGPIALGARPTSGQSRIDLVVARLYDSGSGVGPVKEAKIEVVPGSPNAAPSPPSLPVGAIYLELDRLTVPSSGPITHVQTTQVTVAAGGILPVATTTERDALTTAGIAYRGLVVDNAQSGSLERFNGTTWVAQVDAKVSATYVPSAAEAGWGLASEGIRFFKIGATGLVSINYLSRGAAGNTILKNIPPAFAPVVTWPFTTEGGGVGLLNTDGTMTSGKTGAWGASFTYPLANP
jgi:hypothetical protein